MKVLLKQEELLGLDPNDLAEHLAKAVATKQGLYVDKAPPFEDPHTNDRESELFNAGVSVLKQLEGDVIRLLGLQTEYAKVAKRHRINKKVS